MTGYTAVNPGQWRARGRTMSEKLCTEFDLIEDVLAPLDLTGTVYTITSATITLAGATKINLDGNTEVDGFFNMGTQGAGIAVTTANPYVMELHAKTASNLTAGDSGLSCGIRCRYEVGYDQSNQISMIAVEGRLRPKKDLGDGCHAGVSGTIEASEGAACVLGGTSTTQRNAGNFCVELGENVTCTSGWLTGVTIDSSTHSGVSMASCTYAGLRIKTSSGKEVWEHGIYLDDASATTGITLGTCTTGISIGDCVKGIEVGTFASPVTVQNSDWDTAGGAYTITKVMVSGCLAEDLSDSQCVRQLWSRFKITASQTAGSGKDYYGGEMQVRPHTGAAAIELAGGTYAGVWNYWENSDSAHALTVSGGYHYGSINMIELCSTGVISGGTFAAANMTNHVDTDPASATLFDAILINKVSGAYDWKIGIEFTDCVSDALFKVADDQTICSDSNESILADISGTSNKGFIKIDVAGATRYIALYELKAT